MSPYWLSSLLEFGSPSLPCLSLPPSPICNMSIYFERNQKFIRKENHTWCFNPGMSKAINDFPNTQKFRKWKTMRRRSFVWDNRRVVRNHKRKGPEISRSYVPGSSLTLMPLLPLFSTSQRQVSVLWLCGCKISLHQRLIWSVKYHLYKNKSVGYCITIWRHILSYSVRYSLIWVFCLHHPSSTRGFVVLALTVTV